MKLCLSNNGILCKNLYKIASRHFPLTFFRQIRHCYDLMLFLLCWKCLWYTMSSECGILMATEWHFQNINSAVGILWEMLSALARFSVIFDSVEFPLKFVPGCASGDLSQLCLFIFYERKQEVARLFLFLPILSISPSASSGCVLDRSFVSIESEYNLADWVEIESWLYTMQLNTFLLVL